MLGHEIEKHGHNCASRVLSINTDAITISDDKMNAFYNIANIGLNTSTGEGYGLTALHHATLGQPQVLTALPHYDRNLPAVFIPPLPDREYYEMTEYSGGFHETFASADVAEGLRKAAEMKVAEGQYTPLTWSTALRELNNASTCP